MEHNFIGYGSLLNEESLSETISKKKFLPVIVKGYKRIFNLKTREHKNADVLNLKKSSSSFFNAVLFQVSDEELKKLSLREAEYNLEEVNYYDSLGGRKMGKGIVAIDFFVEIDSEKKLPSKSYFIMCRSAAYKIGKEFGKIWDDTTYIADGEKVSDWIKKNKGYDVLE